MLEAILALLERMAAERPLLLAIEDLHWADGATRDFITFLVRSAREEPLCLVVTYRSDELHRRHPVRPVLAELERAAGVERLSLVVTYRSDELHRRHPLRPLLAELERIPGVDRLCLLYTSPSPRDRS